MESTTRYRNKCAGKKITRSRDKLPQRMRSGARGGRAAKRSAKQRADQRSFEHSKNSDRLLQVRADKQPSPSEAGISSRLPYASPPGVPGSPITPVLEGQLASRGSKLVKEEGMDSNLISGDRSSAKHSECRKWEVRAIDRAARGSLAGRSLLDGNAKYATCSWVERN